ncbi:MAG: hypothetical protein U9O53_05755 [archaeon]|nr:hypothetical protein [archaeon]
MIDVLQELGDAVRQISDGYSTLQKHIIRKTGYGNVMAAGELFDILIGYAKGTDIDSIVDSSQHSQEYIMDILKTIGLTEDEIRLNEESEDKIKEY